MVQVVLLGHAVEHQVGIILLQIAQGGVAHGNEGILEWVPKEQVEQLPIWEGDKIFFRLLEEDRPFFSLKLRYEDDTLAEAVLDGKRLL